MRGAYPGRGAWWWVGVLPHDTAIERFGPYSLHPYSNSPTPLAWGRRCQGQSLGHMVEVLMDIATIGGELAFRLGANIAPQPCIRRSTGIGPRCRHAHRQRSSGVAVPFFFPAWNAMGGLRIPPPRIVIGISPAVWAMRPKLGYPCYFASRDAGRKMTPGGTSPVVTNLQSAMSSLRASATIRVLRFLPSVARALYHCARALFF